MRGLHLGHLAVFLIGGCSGDSWELASGSRELLAADVDGADVRLVVRHHGHHTGWREWWSGSHRSHGDFRRISDEFTVQRMGVAVEVFEMRDIGNNGAIPESDDEAQAMSARLGVDYCTLGSALVFRIRDPAGVYGVHDDVDGAGPFNWGVLRLLSAGAVRGGFSTPTDDCASAAALAPSYEEILDARAAVPPVRRCVAYEVAGLRVGSLRCVFAEPNGDPGVAERLQAAVASGDAEDDLYLALDRDAAWTRPLRPDPFVAVAPDAERRARFLDQARTSCATDHACAPEYVAAIVRLAAAYGAVECSELLDQAAAELGREGLSAARAALAILRQTASCEELEARQAELMLVALERPTLAPEEQAPNAAREPYYSCRPRHTTRACRSLPRVAGSWLAYHCSPAALASAQRIVATHAGGRPVRDPVLDGAQRIVASCADAVGAVESSATPAPPPASAPAEPHAPSAHN